MVTDSLESAPWSLVNGQNGNFVVKLCGLIKSLPFDHRKFVFRPWSWSKWVFLWLNFVVNFVVNSDSVQNFDFRRGHGQNFDHLTMVILKFWLWSWSKIRDSTVFLLLIDRSLRPFPVNSVCLDKVSKFGIRPELS